jgi:hypothetical protein
MKEMTVMPITVWRLQDQFGWPSDCVLSEGDGWWRLIVQRGRKVLWSEQWASDRAALERSTEIWRALRATGWTEPQH